MLSTAVKKIQIKGLDSSKSRLRFYQLIEISLSFVHLMYEFNLEKRSPKFYLKWKCHFSKMGANQKTTTHSECRANNICVLRH